MQNILDNFEISDIEDALFSHVEPKDKRYHSAWRVKAGRTTLSYAQALRLSDYHGKGLDELAGRALRSSQIGSLTVTHLSGFTTKLNTQRRSFETMDPEGVIVITGKYDPETSISNFVEDVVTILNTKYK